MAPCGELNPLPTHRNGCRIEYVTDSFFNTLMENKIEKLEKKVTKLELENNRLQNELNRGWKR